MWEWGSGSCPHERMVLSFLALTAGCMVVTLRSGTQEEKQVCKGLPGDPVVKNQPSNAKGASLISGWGTKIPYVAGQLNRHITMTETLCIVTKIPHTATKTQGSQKKKLQ